LEFPRFLRDLWNIPEAIAVFANDHHLLISAVFLNSDIADADLYK
jgi:hypothetical protein